MAAQTNLPNLAVSESTKAFGVPLLTILVLVALFFFAIKPLWGRVSEAEHEITTARERLVSLTEKEKTLASLSDEDIDSKFEIAEAALPSSKEIPALISGISRLYQEQGLGLIGWKITPGNVATAAAEPAKDGAPSADRATTSLAINKFGFPNDRRVDFDLVLDGTAAEASGFLQTLEKSLRLMVVNSVSYAASNDGKSQVTLKISAPFDFLPPVPGDISDPLPPLLTKDEEASLSNLSRYTRLTQPPPVIEFNGTTNPFGSRSAPVVTEDDERNVGTESASPR